MRDELRDSLMDEATGATIVLTVACGRTSGGAVEPGGLLITRYCSERKTNHKDPVIQLQLRESAIRYCYRMNDELAQFLDGKSDPHSVSMLLDRLSRALDAVGIDLRKPGGIRRRAPSHPCQRKRVAYGLCRNGACCGFSLTLMQTFRRRSPRLIFPLRQA
jgi:hypothetical protein